MSCMPHVSDVSCAERHSGVSCTQNSRPWPVAWAVARAALTLAGHGEGARRLSRRGETTDRMHTVGHRLIKSIRLQSFYVLPVHEV